MHLPKSAMKSAQKSVAGQHHPVVIQHPLRPDHVHQDQPNLVLQYKSVTSSF
jgi:hypothetical protein